MLAFLSMTLQDGAIITAGVLLFMLLVFLLLRRNARRQGDLAHAILNEENGNAHLRDVADDRLTQSLEQDPEVLAAMADQVGEYEAAEEIRNLKTMPKETRHAYVEDAAEGDDPINGIKGQ